MLPCWSSSLTSGPDAPTRQHTYRIISRLAGSFDRPEVIASRRRCATCIVYSGKGYRRAQCLHRLPLRLRLQLRRARRSRRGRPSDRRRSGDAGRCRSPPRSCTLPRMSHSLESGSSSLWRMQRACHAFCQQATGIYHLSSLFANSLITDWIVKLSMLRSKY